MKRLVDGVHAWVHRPPGGVDVTGPARTLSLEAAAVADVVALAHGLADHAPSTVAYQRLRQVGLADEDLPAVDAVAMERLTDLGAAYAWQLVGDDDAAAWVDLLRRVNAQRKVTFQEFGQTTVLPESAAARCLELRRRLGAHARVLLVGDDDMHSPCLAAMGHEVTVLEIDPNLVAFLTRVAGDEDVRLETHCRDVRQALPADLVGRFDAVLTDPMTYRPCLIAFLTRAANALRPGGLLFCAVHTEGRALFDQVLSGLPFRGVDVMGSLNAYHDEGFQESWYHSDLHVLERTASAAPFAPDEVIPFPELIEGAHGSRWHGRVWAASSPWRRPLFAAVAERLCTWRNDAVDIVVSDNDRWGHAGLLLPDGEHVVVSHDQRRGALVATLYPFTAERERSLAALLGPVFHVASTGHYRCEVVPLRRASR